MKKVLFYILIICMPVLSGCNANIGTGFFVGSGRDGGSVIYFFPSVDKSTLTSKDIELINNIKVSARNNGYTVVDANTPDTIGFKATKHIDDISNNDIDGLPDFVVKNAPKFVMVRKGTSKDYYRIKAVVDLTGMNNTEITGTRTYSPSSRINFRMDLPGQITYTNATEKLNNGQSLEWKLIPGEKNLIEANFEIAKAKSQK